MERKKALVLTLILGNGRVRRVAFKHFIDDLNPRDLAENLATLPITSYAIRHKLEIGSPSYCLQADYVLTKRYLLFPSYD